LSVSNISNKQTCSAAISSAPISRGRIPDLLFVSGVVDDCLFQLTDNSFDWKKNNVKEYLLFVALPRDTGF